MNEPLDPLEAELKALQPRGPSPSLRQRIEEALNAHGVGSRLRQEQIHVEDRNAIDSRPLNWWRVALVSGFIAASFLAGLLIIRTWPAKRTHDTAVAPAAVVFDLTRPTYWTYQQALTHSPHELDAILDRHARLSASDPSPPHAFLFTRSDINPLMNGEL